MVKVLQKPKPWLFVLTIGLGILLNPLNSSMISVALVRLQHEFALSVATASWLISAFYLASAAGQPVFGKLSDMFGPKRLFLIGLAIVALASLLAPFSPNFGWLLVCRVLQAIGSSTLFPSGMSMVRKYITEGQAKALATLTVFSSISAAFGPSIGGFLIESLDWQSIFLVNFPFIIVSFVLALFVLPNKKMEKIDLSRIDFVGIALFAVAMVTFILFLLSLGESIRWWSLPIALAGFIVFYYYEKHRKEPFIDLKTLKSNKNLSFVYLQYICINLVFYCYFFGLPIFLQDVRGYSEGQTGLIMLAMAGCGVFVAPIAGRWIDKSGSKPPLISGAVTILLGTILLLTIGNHSPLWWLIIIMIILGMSNGFNNISMQTALYDNVTPEETGAASGLFQTSRYLGSISSSTILGLLFSEHLDIAHLHTVVYVCIVGGLLVLALSLRLPSKRKKRVA
ncbi:EmrB/QacA subfamily drug resistance transporter [Pullulanibacillus pueri]|uniref:MFS transporter n=1 Tax=Pullulanibacillus pueri TaxID=1437324 RepID=A0A8J2ZU13_9BACL|nr:MFS transporter [Pullulanibacillus pueri]MBM7680761.1 EmrB/QacA subfamily drug resistance transporter [Pullulanibacillus pueri]GGH78231.1 MFS transporter [Pullulanibacillus pueri]